MTKEEKKDCCCNNKENYWMKRGKESGGGGDAVYGLGLIGALVYYLGHANSFQTVIMGILKSLVWPAVLIYHFLNFLKL
jgi:hypothetical protein